jgi:DNA-binding transcriptional regulator YiaG
MQIRRFLVNGVACGDFRRKLRFRIVSDVFAMTAAQCRAARAILMWTQQEFASRAGVAALTVRTFESEKAAPRRATLEVMQLAFEKAGIEFLGNDGLRKR